MTTEIRKINVHFVCSDPLDWQQTTIVEAIVSHPQIASTIDERKENVLNEQRIKDGQS